MDLISILTFAWIPLVTALIGWLTNWVAIRMLFHPRTPITILGYTIQGLVPRRQEELAEKIADVVEREFLNAHTIQEQVDKIEFDAYIEELSGRLVRENLGTKLQAIPFIGSMINDSTLTMLEGMVVQAMQEESSNLKTKLASELEKHFNIREVVMQKVNALDLEQLERLVTHVAHKEFRTIELLGAVLGFVVGLAQLVILFVLGNLG